MAIISEIIERLSPSLTLRGPLSSPPESERVIRRREYYDTTESIQFLKSSPVAKRIRPHRSRFRHVSSSSGSSMPPSIPPRPFPLNLPPLQADRLLVPRPFDRQLLRKRILKWKGCCYDGEVAFSSRKVFCDAFFRSDNFCQHCISQARLLLSRSILVDRV